MIEENHRSQKPAFRSQNGLEVASLRRLGKMDRAEGEFLILNYRINLAAEPFISDLAQRTRFSKPK